MLLSFVLLLAMTGFRFLSPGLERPRQLLVYLVLAFGYFVAISFLVVSAGERRNHILVQNGKALVAHSARRFPAAGGPGELIVRQGNIAVLERSGKITRIVNAGITQLRPRETIRDVFSLNPKRNSAVIEHVLTQDGIPLDITLTMAYQIEPASLVDKRSESRHTPEGEALTRKLDDGLYQVYEATIRKALWMSQAGTLARLDTENGGERMYRYVIEATWERVAGNLPDHNLRDYIMAHRFDELFELDGIDGKQPEIRVRTRKIYEIEQAMLEEIGPGRLNSGVLVRGLDIGKIKFPERVEHILLNRWEAESEAKRRVILGRAGGEARAEYLHVILDATERMAITYDRETVAMALRQLISTMPSLQDLETYARVMSSLKLTPSRAVALEEEQDLD
jgi:regulator of protease activity HflC (stomatin/prohibitin superfamily)